MSAFQYQLMNLNEFTMANEVRSWDWKIPLKDVRVSVVLIGIPDPADPTVNLPPQGTAKIIWKHFEATEEEIVDLSLNDKGIVAISCIGERYGIVTGIEIDLTGVTNLQSAKVRIFAK